MAGASPAGDQVHPSAASPKAKRKMVQTSGISNAEHKRIKFVEDIEERSEYRGTLEYYRGAKEYVPGRYAVTEGSEYEDTSGSTISFAKFTGQKKMGSKFVNITPKEEVYDGKERSSVVKKTPKVGDKKNFDGLDKPDSPEKAKHKSQMSSRELRLSRRARSTTPPAATKPRRVSARREEQKDIPQEAAYGAPALVVSLKVPKLPNDHVLANGGILSSVSRHVEEGQRSSDDAGSDEAATGGTEPPIIERVVSNIQRELRYLQQTMVLPKYTDMVSKATYGCQEALEPLKPNDHIKPYHAAGAGSPQEEDGSIYFEASDGTGGSTFADMPDLCANDSSNAGEVVPEWNEAPLHNEYPSESDVSPTLDVNTLDDMPKRDKQSMSEALELKKSVNDHGENDGPLANDVKVDQENLNDYSTRPVASPSYTSNGVNTASLRRSGRLSSTAPLHHRSPENILNKAPARPSTSRSWRPAVAPSRRPPASSIPNLLKSEQHGRDAHRSEELNVDACSSILELNGNKIAAEGLQDTGEAVAARQSGFHTAGTDASPHNSHNASQDPTKPPTTVEALCNQPHAQRAAGGMYQGVGELMNGPDKKQGDSQCESDARSGASHSSHFANDNDNKLGVALVGEAGVESDGPITDTDRQRAGQEAPVDPDTTANGSIEPRTTIDDLSADRRVANTIGTSNAELQDAVRSSRRPRNTSGDRGDASIRLAVQIPWNQRTDASQPGGQNESLHLIATGHRELNSANRSLGYSGAIEVSPEQHRRISSLRFNMKVSYVRHDPGTGLANKIAKDKTRSADVASAVPQVIKEHASAARDPKDVAQ
ncbi:hypothetical protein E8E12_010623 [Didymella heteroderae]|uniref:Uncharacterized protein n=1 Tax=Didymella heteroderae TaxID=1769908 RepID=A0A9P5C5S1_9PLEO|nr:hypothetical protein E8E12_010623 [Didymella heteroderae]